MKRIFIVTLSGTLLLSGCEPDQAAFSSHINNIVKVGMPLEMADKNLSRDGFGYTPHNPNNTCSESQINSLPAECFPLEYSRSNIGLLMSCIDRVKLYKTEFGNNVSSIKAYIGGCFGGFG